MRMIPGVDVVDVAEVAGSVERFGDRYLRRIHRPEEVAELRGLSPRRRAEHLAGRFAAKEAVFKALRMPSTTGMAWTCIEVVRGDDGAPDIRLHGTARHWAHLSGIGEVTVSISHDAGRAVAMAIAHQHHVGTGTTEPSGHAQDHQHIHSPTVQEDIP